MSGAKYRPSRGIFETAVDTAAAVGRGVRARYWAAIATLATLAAAGGTWGAIAAWQAVRERVMAADEYRLTAADIEITPPPPWVRGDLRMQVLHDAGLDAGMSILDDGLVERLHQAFALHPWVAEVVRVSKRRPAHVDIELVYRRPAAMVEFHGAEASGLYPVDADGVLLPSDDFPPVEALAYPRLAGIESGPLGVTPGTRWGDPIVAGGARIAAALQPAWGTLGLRDIHAVKPAASSGVSAAEIYELTTAAGAAIPWGAAPGSEPSGEPTAEQKVARLQSLAAQYGTLDAPELKGLDLRRPDVTPRTTRRENP